MTYLRAELVGPHETLELEPDDVELLLLALEHELEEVEIDIREITDESRRPELEKLRAEYDELLVGIRDVVT